MHLSAFGRRATEGGPAAPGASRGVLILSPQPFYEERGTPIAVLCVLEALSESGGQTDLLTFPVGKNVELPGLRIIRIGSCFGFRRIPVGLSLRKALLDVFMIVSALGLLVKYRYDYIHALEEMAFPAIIFGRLFGTPVVYDMQSSLPEQLQKTRFFRLAPLHGLLLALERWVIRCANLVMCSAGLKAHVQKAGSSTHVLEWHYPNCPVDVLNSEKDNLRGQHNIPLDAPVVLYSGNFEHYQGVARLVEAATYVVDRLPNAVLVLVGESHPGDRPQSEYLAKLEESGALRIVERQPRQIMPKYMAIADVLVSPREHGVNLPLKVFDYLASGKPIVATDIPAHRAILNQERAALVEVSATAMAGEIVRLLQDPERACSLGTAARKYAEEKLGWNLFVEQIKRIPVMLRGETVAPKPNG